MLGEVARPDLRTLRLSTVRVRFRIGRRIGEVVEMPSLRVDAAVKAGAVEIVDAKESKAKK